MKLEKAIELNKESEESLRKHKFIDHADAIKLGIEALKAIEVYRSANESWLSLPLPGETKE